MLASILAVTIFLAMFVLIVLDKIEHYLITLGCLCPWYLSAQWTGYHGSVKR